MIKRKRPNTLTSRNIKLSKEDYDIYSKQIRLNQIGTEGQKKLQRSRVLIIGAGGLGCPTMIYLAISGIGFIGIIDEDKVEKSNLNRQTLYNKNDIGKAKTLSAKSQLNYINKNCKIITHRYRLSKNNNVEILSNYDIIVDATDNFQTRYIIDETCHKLHKICIYGAVKEFEGQIAVFNYKNGIRYKDLYQKELKIMQNTCNNRGIMGITTGYIGTLQAIEVIKMILGINKKCKNFVISYNIIEEVVKKKLLYLKRVISINNKKESQRMLSKNKSNHERNKISIVIDLRNNKDFKIRHIKKSINIPIIQFKLNQTIKLINNFRNIGEIIIHCTAKEKSVIASKFLAQYSIEHKIKM
uniref:Molybdopterin biosynthesis protein n=1 Tax=Vertebrata thuyoides TaxID=2006970 RepID=A0A1Z1MAT9_9FLOR|nr:Molybdopterin biosynthesis protein [Vertebrata thuyoides]ARW63198.1 Molybdopterin biosynthesis protein [Vertebrata thuyoides]